MYDLRPGSLGLFATLFLNVLVVELLVACTVSLPCMVSYTNEFYRRELTVFSFHTLFTYSIGPDIREVMSILV